MRYLLLAIIAILLLTLTGCFVTSLNSLDDGTKRTIDNALLGSWSMSCPTDSAKTCSATVMQGDDQTYVIEYTDSRRVPASFKAVLVKLGDDRYLDVSIKELAEEQSERMPEAVVAHMAPAHSFWKVAHDGDHLQLVQIEADALNKLGVKDLQTSDPWQDQQFPLLVSRTDELQRLVTLHGAELFVAKPWTWLRVAAQPQTVGP